jgi:hypothetical protein
MKPTKKIAFSIALIALSVIAFAQPFSRKERLSNRQANQPVYMLSEYVPNESGRIENWMYDLSSWATNRTSRKAYEAPVVIKSYFIDSPDLVSEADIELESWMTKSFECGPAEEVLRLESWMTEPFESSENVEVEEWMTSAWI